MKLSELKDGMVLTNRDGCDLLFFNHSIYTCEDMEFHDYISNYNNILKGVCSVDDDIMKVSYMGETLWERVEYVSFMEAVENGSFISHKDAFLNYELCDVLDFIARLSIKDKTQAENMLLSNDWIISKRKS